MSTRATHIADPSLRRAAPGVWIGGSPLRVFSVTEPGDDLLAELVAAGAGVRPGTGAQRRLLDRLVAAGAAHPVAQPVAARRVAAEVTVVVPVHDDAESLARLLASLERGADGARVVVVDDGSGDPGEVERLVRAAGGHLVRRDRNAGPAAARNLGTSVVDTPVIAFVDADVVVQPGWLRLLLSHLDDGVGIVAPRVRSRPGTDGLSLVEEHLSPLDLGPLPGRVAPLTAVSYLPAAALVVSTATFEELGGFSEDMEVGEDVDLVWRACAAGIPVRYEPAAVVTHAPRPTWRAWLSQRVAYGSSAAALDLRHRGLVAPAAMSPWSAAGWIVGAVGHPVVGAVVLAGSVAALPGKLPELPAPVALQLAVSGHAVAGRQLARTTVRVWWPLALAGALASRRLRRLAVAALLGHIATGDGPLSRRLAAVVDDVAYGAGVWRGVLRERSVGALLPRFTRSQRRAPIGQPLG